MFTKPNIPLPDHQSGRLAQERQNNLTKPIGSLGILEALSIQLAAITANPLPKFDKKAVIIMAGDHGIASEGVSAYPSSVTKQMVYNFLAGGAAINVLARLNNAKVVVVDIGVASDLEPHPNLLQRKVAYGTKNMLSIPAMTIEEAETTIQTGIEVVNSVIDSGINLVATGEMGIGNTTPSSAITAIYSGLAVREVTGRGTGIDDEGLSQKIAKIEQAIDNRKPNKNNPLDVLSKVGGFEIGGLAGVILGAASRRIPIVIDGFISGAAALIAYEIEPAVKPYLIASHQSVERGHQAILKHIGLKPLLNLDLRLGEGTGAVLAFNLIDAATALLREMATFDEAGVSKKSSN